MLPLLMFGLGCLIWHRFPNRNTGWSPKNALIAACNYPSHVGNCMPEPGLWCRNTLHHHCSPFTCPMSFLLVLVVKWGRSIGPSMEHPNYCCCHQNIPLPIKPWSLIVIIGMYTESDSSLMLEFDIAIEGNLFLVTNVLFPSFSVTIFMAVHQFGSWLGGLKMVATSRSEKSLVDQSPMKCYSE